jgi:2-polyprenyl-3-methyl-5-hydroxy-6-metoxy-1,4-benzoquinol methylase
MGNYNKSKLAVGGAVKRDKPSRSAEFVAPLAKGKRTLDFGCGFGFDADHFGWDSYDIYYRPTKPQGPYDVIICTNVISALTRKNRTKVINEIRDLLVDDGMAYFAVVRNIPVGGKLGVGYRHQNYVVLTLPSVFCDDKMEIYRMTKTAEFDDKTKDFNYYKKRR